MEPHDFLAAVLPSSGKYCVAVIHGNVRKHIFVDSYDNLYQTAVDSDGTKRNTYMAVAAFDDAGTRRAEHATAVRSLFVDLDCGVADSGASKAFPNKRAAVGALEAFLQSTGLGALGQPWLVDSGGGVHAYWPLDEDAPPAQWQPVAEAFKRLAKQEGLPIDMTVTADAARVLRMPGTHNWKYDPPRPVQLRHRGATFSLFALEQAIRSKLTTPVPAPRQSLVLPGTPVKAAQSPTAIALLGNSVVHFRTILQRTSEGTGCGQLAHYIEHAKEDGMEPLWRGLLSLAKVCVDGDKAARVLSRMHPYDDERMHRKLAEIKGPYPCAKLDSENPGVCASCPHWGKITNPLALGRTADTVVEPTSYELPPEDDGPPVHINRPEPPRGFSFGRHGGVYMFKPADKGDGGDREVMVLPFDFFMVDMLRDGDMYVSRFMAIKGGKKVIVAIPNKAAATKDETIKTLASQNILASFGAGNDVNLYNYVRAAITEASTTESVLVVPPRFGWQADGNFALGDTVYSQQGPAHDYTFVSDRLHNIMDITTARGDLRKWQEVFELLRKKNLWGHLAMAGIGFGSALMQFMPASSRAMTFHIASKESGIGKTLALSMCNSVWGDPTTYSVKPSTSDRTVMQRAGLLGSLPLSIDEITNNARAADKEWLPRHVFEFSQEGHKLKGSAHGNTEVRNDLYWASLCLLTSNAPAMEQMMGARKHTSDGEAMRMLEWRGQRVNLDWEPGDREVLSQLNPNSGVAGAAFVRYLVTHQDVVRKVVAETVVWWRDFVKATDAERYWTSGCAAIIAGYLLAGPKHANVVEIPVTPIAAHLKFLVQEARRIINSNRSTALDILNAYVRENNGNFVKMTGSTALATLNNGMQLRPDTTRGAVRGRVEHGVTPGIVDLFIEVRLLKAHCAEMGRSYIDFVRELQAQATVIETRKDLLAQTQGPSMRVAVLKITRRVSELDANDPLA